MLAMAGAAGLGACERTAPELATEHIRAVLNGAAPGALMAPGALTAPEAEAEGDPEAMDAEAAGAPEYDPASPPVITLATGDTVHVSEPVAEYYRLREYEPAWTGYDELSPGGRRMLAAIGTAEFDGVDPDRYRFGAARALARALSEGEAGDRKLEYLGDLDLLLTESFTRLAVDLDRGLLDPESGGQRWRIPRPDPDPDAVVSRLGAGEDPVEILASIRPSHPYYSRLAEAHRRLRAVEERGGWSTVPDGGTLRQGERDARVGALRARLLAGDDPREHRLAGVGRADPDHFDEALEEAIEHFQLRHTLHEDGAVGPETLVALNIPVSDRLELIRLNLDRWRWLPRGLGEMFVLVNVAGFELEVVEGDRAIESMSVVVGRTANATPLFQDTLEYMVVNPYWNVPASIAQAEIIPAAQRDPGYLARNNYEVLYNDRAVSTGWVSYEDVASGRYRIRQRPGPANALGNVKFLFPNDMNIYLHDSPAGHLFSQRTRAFSYGCIRVERPADLARLLLERLTDRDPSDYDQLRSKSGEQWVTLTRQIPIYILYFTAWAHADGALRFHPDIYGLDEALEAERAERLPPAPPRAQNPPNR